MPFDEHDVAVAANQLRHFVQQPRRFRRELRLPRREQQLPADGRLPAGADRLRFIVNAGGRLARDRAFSAVARALHRVERLELFHQQVDVDRVLALRVGDVAERVPDRRHLLDPIAVQDGHRLLGPRLEHPQDDEQPHHAHDQIGEREDPLGALFALVLFALAGRFGHAGQRSGFRVQGSGRRDRALR